MGTLAPPESKSIRTPSSAQFEDVILTPEEEAEALRVARRNKFGRENTLKYVDEITKPQPKIELTPDQMLEVARCEFLRLEKKEMVIDQHNEKIISILARYFSGDKTLEAEGISLDKGILLFGSFGVGKTSLLNAFSENPLRSFIIRNCKELAQSFASGGYEQIENFTSPHPPIYGNKFKHEYYGICFDDLGTEDKRKHYGNESNVMMELIETRYSRKATLAGFTHITTNLTADQIEEVYGPRVRSRVREMFNFLVYKPGSPDRRK